MCTKYSSAALLLKMYENNLWYLDDTRTTQFIDVQTCCLDHTHDFLSDHSKVIVEYYDVLRVLSQGQGR